MSEIDWSKAPEGATHYDGGVFYRRNEGRWEYCDPYVRVWRESNNEAPFFDRLLVRPSRPQWRGPEDGLPPVGTVCEFAEGLSQYVIAEDHQGWPGEALEVLAHRDTGKPVAVVWNLRRKQASTVIAECLRPLKSDKERAVEAAMKVMPYPCSPSTRTDLECAYDAGLLRLPEEQS